MGEEERLERLRVHLETAQRIANLGSWVGDLATGDLEWSPTVHQIFGWPEGAPVSYDAVLRAVHPDDRRRLLQVHEDALADGSSYTIDLRILRPDGEVRYLREEAVVERDHAGKPARLIGVVQDITARTLLTRSTVDTESRRRELLHRLMRTTEQERARLAGDLHDGPIQLLTVAAMRLEHLRMTHESPPEWLSDAIDTIRATMMQLRDTLYELRPTLPAAAGLRTSLGYLAATILPAASVTVEVEGEKASDASARELLGLVQEVLWSLRDHDGSTTVEVHVDITAGEVALDVVADGAPPTDRGWGRMAYLGVQHRAEALGGTCTLRALTDEQQLRCRFPAVDDRVTS